MASPVEILSEMALGDGGKHGHHGGVKPIPTIIPTPNEFEDASAAGTRALWVVFVVMVLASATFSALSWRIPVSRRLYHVVTTFITVTAAVSYFAMATGQGTSWSCVRVDDHHDDPIPDTHHAQCRAVFWARYVDWALTTPLLLLDLCLLAGIDGAHTVMAIVADLVMVLTGLFASFGRTSASGHGRKASDSKWTWFGIACVAYIVVVWHVAVHGTNSVRAKGVKARALFGSLAVFTLILWTAYPVVWGFADGSRIASVDAEIIAYAILDILAKPVFGLWLLIAHRRIPETNIEIGGWWAQGLSSEGRIRLPGGGNDDEGA